MIHLSDIHIIIQVHLSGIKKPKQECRDKFLSKEKYMKVILKALYLLPSFSNS